MALFEDRINAAEQLAKKVKEWLDKNMAIDTQRKEEIERRLQSFKGERKGKEDSDYYNNYNNFEGKTVVLVDDGIATGATMLSAAQWLKTKQNCCKILIVAVPVAPPPPSLQSSNE